MQVGLKPRNTYLHFHFLFNLNWLWFSGCKQRERCKCYQELDYTCCRLWEELHDHCHHDGADNKVATEAFNRGLLLFYEVGACCTECRNNNAS